MHLALLSPSSAAAAAAAAAATGNSTALAGTATASCFRRLASAGPWLPAAAPPAPPAQRDRAWSVGGLDACNEEAAAAAARVHWRVEEHSRRASGVGLVAVGSVCPKCMRVWLGPPFASSSTEICRRRPHFQPVVLLLSILACVWVCAFCTALPLIWSSANEPPCQATSR